MLCQAFAEGTLFTGCHDGNINIWAGEVVKSSIQHNTNDAAPVFVMVSRKSGSIPGIISGGKDGTIVIWTFDGTKLIKQKHHDLRHPDVKSLNP